MKQTRTLLIVSLLFSLMLNTHAQKDRTLSNGFSIQFIVGIPSAEYGVDESLSIPEEFQYSTLFGLQLGNRWYFTNSDQFGIGLMVNWFDISTAMTENVLYEETITWLTAEATLLELGPIGTYAINSTMAVDAYYNLRPTGLVSASIDEDNSLSDDYYGSGFTHALGAAFRWKVLSVGIESVFGKIKDLDDPEIKLQANNFRFVIGVKF